MKTKLLLVTVLSTVTTLLALAPTRVRAVDLQERYPTSLTAGDVDPAHARPWSFEQGDIFRLSKFELKVGDEFKVEMREADLGVAHCADGAVWAVVLPRNEAEAQVTSSAASEPEPISLLWLRLHPKEIDRLFPPDTVFADGDTKLMQRMRDIADARFRSSWHAGRNALIPEPKDLTVDMDTSNGLRRFFVVDTEKGTANYASAFEQRAFRPTDSAETQISLESAPPVVVKTLPVAGATEVDPALTEIKVTYSKAMQDGSWSWSTWGEETFPDMVGQPKYLADGRTCVLTVKLQPGKFYATWLNSDRFHNFKDTSGRPAVPYLLTFRTSAEGAVASNPPAEVVDQAIHTISQCTESDPRVAEALTKLRAVPEAQVVAALVPYLDSTEATIRRSAVYVLWRGGFTDISAASAPLQKLLTHEEDLTRGMAALALGQNHVRQSFEGLATMTKEDSSGYARRCAAYALGLLGDPRAEPVLKAATKDAEPLVQSNAQAALKMLESAKKAAGTTDGTLIERTVNKAVSEFPETPDPSTPEGACAAWQRASARKDVQAINQLSLVPLDAKEQENWYQREEKRDPQGMAIYLKALADSKIVAVQVYRGELANVITYLPFPEGKGRSPYSSRSFGLVNGAWKNLGEDRLPDLEAGRANFEMKKERLWQHFTELKAKAASAMPARQSTAATDPALTGLNDDQRAALAWTDRQFHSYFDARTFDGWSAVEIKSLEAKSIDALSGPRSRDYYQAISTLGALRSTNALPRLRELAFERVDRNNRDRWMAVRVLGMVGDRQSIPDLIHLVYHGNQNTHWWAQISLVRLTGQNFGSDWNAWGRWWNDQNGQPPYNPEIIRWWSGQAEPDKLAESLAEADRKFLADVKPPAN